MTEGLAYREFLVDTASRLAIGAVIGVVTALAVWVLTTGSASVFLGWFATRPEGVLVRPTADWLATLAIAVGTGGVLLALGLRLLPGGVVAGPPDTLHALADPDRPVSIRAGIGSTLLATISTATGGAVGLYGPLIHFGSVVAEGVRRTLGTDRHSWPTLVGCGIAAAISAAFLAPIGAALFATEFAMRRMNLRDFLPLAVASSAAWGCAVSLGTRPVFELPPIDFDLGLASLAPTVVLGLILGFTAMGFTRAIESATRLATRWIRHPASGPLWAALVLFGLGAFVPDVLGTGVSFLQGLFARDLAVGTLLVLAATKLLATCSCVALRFYGGLFAPSLVLGAIVGALVAALLGQLSLLSPADLTQASVAFPVIAAFSVASALVGAPFAASIIILEMTQSYEIAALGFATSVITCYLYSALMGRSFFDRRLHERGMSYEETAPVRRLRATPVRSLAASLDDIEDRIETARAQLGAIRAGRARAPKLDARTPAMEARRELDRGGNAVVEVDLGVGETEDPRRFVHIAALDEFAWRLMLADSEAGILGPLQARDFVSLFESDLARELDPRELELLEAFGRLRVARAGEPLLRQGESSRNFFIVNAGVVRVRHREGDDGRTVAWLRSGAVFGEVSFLTGAPRSADVEASTDCIVQEFRPEFVGLAHHGSEMHRALSKLARRRGVRLRTDPPPAER